MHEKRHEHEPQPDSTAQSTALEPRDGRLESDGEHEGGEDQEEDPLEDAQQEEDNDRSDEGNTHLDPVGRWRPVLTPSLGLRLEGLGSLAHPPPVGSLGTGDKYPE